MMMQNIQIVSTASDFEREKLIRPFGLKGGTLSELWQTAVLLQSDSGQRRIGLGTQSVLYGDADLFAACSEGEANALMYLLTSRCLEIVKKFSFSSPVELQEHVFPEAQRLARQLTGRQDIHPNFVLNALIPIDHAAWLIYAAENGRENFESMIPDTYRQVLASRHRQIAIMFQVPYGMPVEEIQGAVRAGYFIIKIKLGQAGSEPDMLQKDMNRLSMIHSALKDIRSEQTADGKLLYTLDANGRYREKQSVEQLIDHLDTLGIREQVLLFEEPLDEKQEVYVGNLGVRIAADESLHDEAHARQKLEQGYRAFVLKSIAKTLSLTLKIARIAADHQVPCLCADLTVNPILLSWHQNLAARLPAFPGLEDTGIMETNGRENYQQWKRMLTYHPEWEAAWLMPEKGLFRLDDDFYQKSGGIFSTSRHYENLVRHQ